MMQIDSYSFDCGQIDGFNRLVALGVKSLAMLRPQPSREAREALIEYAHENCRRYGTKLYPEDDPLVTDLLPLSESKGTFNLLLYRDDHVIEDYIRLKERKESMVANRVYFGGNRSRVAWDLGRLLSYPEEAIRRLIADNTDKEIISTT